MQLAYQIAPSATYYFAAGGNTVQSAADAVTALQSAGCNIIIDDLGFVDQESMYQTGSVWDQAIENAVAAGANYFSAAGNDGNNYVQRGFTPITVNIPGVGNVIANDFGDNSPYLSVTIPKSAKASGLFLQWVQPFRSYGSSSAGAANSLGVYLLNDQDQVVASTIVNQVSQDPTQFLDYKNTSDSTSFKLVVVQNGGTVPAGEIFTVSNANSNVTFDGPLIGGGTGNIFGHELLANTNVVGAANYSTAPSFGGKPTIEDYSQVGPGVLYYNAQGDALPTPITPNVPSFTSVDGSSTAVEGFAPFGGTSAAAPNAGAVGALMLQANTALSTTDLSALLAQSAIPVFTTTGNAGAGLIQARAGVELANAAGGTRWSSVVSGDWTTGGNWSSGLQPGSDGAVMLSDNLGALTASYTVSVDTAGDSAGSLTLSAPTGMTVGLSILAGGTLSVGGPTTNNITAGDFLVAERGQLIVDQGSLKVSGSLNSNDGSIDIEQGSATASNFTQNSGALTVGGYSVGASLGLGGSTGVSQTGGSITVQANGTLYTTTLTASASTMEVASGGDMVVTGNAYIQNVVLTDAGQLQANSLSIEGGSSMTIAQGATVTAGVLSVGNGGTVDASVTDNSSLLDDGALGGADDGTILIGSSGILTVGASSSNANIKFTGGNGLLDYTSNNSSILTRQLDATIFGFGQDSGAIEFGSLMYNPLLSYTYTYDLSDGELDIFAGSVGLAGVKLNNETQYDGFQIQAAKSNALEVVSVACFASGTRIMTPRGPIAVEALRIGDAVMTADGAAADVVWIGSRTVDCQAHPDPKAVWPVCISAHAFGPGKPGRDLYLSPDHAIHAEGVLIPVKYVIDGNLVRQVKRSTVTYFHIELTRHDILLAEDLPTESYLDTGMHADFGGGTYCEAFWEAVACAPLRIVGKEVDRVAARLRKRARALGQPCAAKPRRRSVAGGAATTADLAQALDADWYLANNPDVAAAGLDAHTHYAKWGRPEGRLPCDEIDLVRALGLVDSGTAVFTMDDVLTAHLDPVVHFCTHGWRERRRPNPYFDTAWYADSHDVPPGMNPLAHYVLTGERLGHRPSEHFDPAWYAQRYALGASMSALAHYLKHRRKQRVSPLPSFDVAAYRRAHAATMRPGRDPYAHFLAVGQFATAGAEQVASMAA